MKIIYLFTGSKIGILLIIFCFGIFSATFRLNVAYWIGASDEIFEGDFRWTNGFPYTFSHWFPGWTDHNNYNKQPNDDGIHLMIQSCYIISTHFRYTFLTILSFIQNHDGFLGLSAQDCVELRRYFRIPPVIQAKTKLVPVTLTHMWNDRDCNEKNFFLCERPLSDGKILVFILKRQRF